MKELYTITETLLSYERAQLQAWCSGDRSLMPAGAFTPDSFATQPAYHFAEALALGHFARAGGWQGFSAYALGPQYPNSEQRRPGREMVKRVVPEPLLAAFLGHRAREPRTFQFGTGEPDLFLYRGPGDFMFAEVKKEADTISIEQLACIAAIVKYLRCTVQIVYARASDQPYRPKTYQLDLEACRGWRVSG